MFSSRAKFLAFAACITIVGVAAGLKVEQSPEPISESLSPPVLTENDTDSNAPKTIDPTFFEGQGVPADQAALTSSVQSSSSAEAFVSPEQTLPANTVSAEAYLVGDVSTGKIYLEKDSSLILPAASMSKLLTAITATDMYSSTTEIEITPADTDVPADLSGLVAGERFTANELLYPLLLDSSNVAAEALASSINRATFLELMTSYAWEIGMSGSFSADPSGLSEDDQGSVSGFFKLARYLYQSRPDILAITRIRHISVATTTDHGAHEFLSIHPFVTDPRFLGGKTGHTNAALDTMLTILNIDGHPIVFIVLRSLDRTKDTELLIGKFTEILTGN